MDSLRASPSTVGSREEARRTRTVVSEDLNLYPLLCYTTALLPSPQRRWATCPLRTLDCCFTTNSYSGTQPGKLDKGQFNGILSKVPLLKHQLYSRYHRRHWEYTDQKPSSLLSRYFQSKISCSCRLELKCSGATAGESGGGKQHCWKTEGPTRQQEHSHLWGLGTLVVASLRGRKRLKSHLAKFSFSVSH